MQSPSASGPAEQLGGGAGPDTPGGPATSAPIELEHAIGFSASCGKLCYHPNGKKFICAAGASLVVCDFADAHDQVFLRGHDRPVTCLALSNSGRFVASGQHGDNSDAIVWDYEGAKLLYRLSEHDHGIQVFARAPCAPPRTQRDRDTDSRTDTRNVYARTPTHTQTHTPTHTHKRPYRLSEQRHNRVSQSECGHIHAQSDKHPPIYPHTRPTHAPPAGPRVLG